MRSRYTTILLLTKQSTAAESIRVRTHWVRYFKFYLFGGFTLFFSLCSFFVFYYQMKNRETQKMQRQLTALQTQLNDKGLEVLKNNLHGVEDKIKLIETYLKKRGVISKDNIDVGGDVSDDYHKTEENDQHLEEKAHFYNKQLNKIQYALFGTPMGLPHKGEISSNFGIRGNPISGSGIEHHKCIDFRGPVGSPISVTADGKVVFAGWEGGYGNCIRIDHASGFQTVYAHLSAIDVFKGQRVTAGQLIGKLGNTGRSTGPHLHYEIRKDNVPLDPEPFLNF